MGGLKPLGSIVGMNPWPSSWGNQVHISEGTAWFGILVNTLI